MIKTSSYVELLSKDGSVSIHHKNLQNLVVEILKSSMDYVQNDE